MTIIHLISGIAIAGGAEQMVFKLSKKCVENNIKPIAVAITDVGSDNNLFTGENLEHHFLNVKSLSDIKRALKELDTIVRNNNEVVFHSHMFHACLLSTIHSLFYKKTPIVFTMHNNQVNQIYRRLLLFFLKPFRNIDIIFSANSQKWYLKNNAIIANGVDINHFKSTKPRNYTKGEQFNFVFIGNFIEQKNPLYLIDIVKKLKEKKYDFVINMLGEGPLRKDLETEAKKNNLESYFNIVGVVKDIIPYLTKSHCLIMPSLWEGMPITIIESAAAKLPMVVTPVGSIPDFLNDTNASVSNLDEFPATMIHVIDNYDDAKIKADKLFEEIIYKFDIDSVFNQHLDAYKKALGTN